jgi:hypothetical protein
MRFLLEVEGIRAGVLPLEKATSIEGRMPEAD